MIPTYDWTEPDIVKLVQRNHTPDEEVTVVTVDGGANTRIACDFCGNPWPCAVLLDLRADLDERKRVALGEERSKK